MLLPFQCWPGDKRSNSGHQLLLLGEVGELLCWALDKGKRVSHKRTAQSRYHDQDNLPSPHPSWTVATADASASASASASAGASGGDADGNGGGGSGSSGARGGSESGQGQQGHLRVRRGRAKLRRSVTDTINDDQLFGRQHRIHGGDSGGGSGGGGRGGGCGGSGVGECLVGRLCQCALLGSHQVVDTALRLLSGTRKCRNVLHFIVYVNLCSPPVSK